MTNTSAHPDTIPAPPPRRRGFATLSQAQVSAIASKGGKAAHAAGTAHEFTTEEARAAGRKGGKAMHAKRRTAVADVSRADETNQDVEGREPA